LLPYLQNTNYKNSKLNKYYIKQFGNYKNDPKQPGTVSGRLLELPEQWWRVAPLATAIGGSRAAADEGGRNRWIGNLFLFSVSLRRR
jgi:hypothetical protein